MSLFLSKTWRLRWKPKMLLSFANTYICHRLARRSVSVTVDGWMTDRIHPRPSIYVMIWSSHPWWMNEWTDGRRMNPRIALPGKYCIQAWSLCSLAAKLAVTLWLSRGFWRGSGFNCWVLLTFYKVKMFEKNALGQKTDETSKLKCVGVRPRCS